MPQWLMSSNKHHNILQLAPESFRHFLVMDAAKAYMKQRQIMDKHHNIVNLKQTPCLKVNDVCD